MLGTDSVLKKKNKQIKAQNGNIEKSIHVGYPDAPNLKARLESVRSLLNGDDSDVIQRSETET
jgi:hypothetical protein